MRGKLLQIYFNLRSSFWLIPMLMAVAGLLLAYATLYIDETAIGRNISGWLPVPQINVAGSRQIVSTVAGSVITVASLVFSLTFVALTLMSQQLGPRILVLFMDDRPTQLIIGFFVATFLYALMVLATIGTGAIENFAPQFSIYMVCFLAIFTFGLVIYFVHHIAQSLQADNVIATLGRELSSAIEQSLLSDTDECKDQQPEYQSGEEHQALREIGKPIRSRRSGYVQLVDYKAAVALAEEHDAVIRFPCRPGHFLISSAVVARVTSSSFLDDELNDQFCDLVQIGSQRSQAQYAEFEFNALVEVALRALSPGVNDAYTAIACINEITDGLARILRGRRRLDALMSDNGTRIWKREGLARRNRCLFGRSR